MPPVIVTIIMILFMVTINHNWNWRSIRVKKREKAPKPPGFWLGEPPLTETAVEGRKWGVGPTK